MDVPRLKQLSRRSLRLVTAVFVLAAVSAPVLGSLPFVSAALGGTVYAQDCTKLDTPEKKAACEACLKQTGVDTSNCDLGQQTNEFTTNCPQGQCIIQKYIQPAMNTLSAMVGIAVTISIIVAGIRYGTSADNPQKVSEAKQRIVNSIFVLVGYFFFYALMNYLIPGGLL